MRTPYFLIGLMLAVQTHADECAPEKAKERYNDYLSVIANAKDLYMPALTPFFTGEAKVIWAQKMAAMEAATTIDSEEHNAETMQLFRAFRGEIPADASTRIIGSGPSIALEYQWSEKTPGLKSPDGFRHTTIYLTRTVKMECVGIWQIAGESQASENVSVWEYKDGRVDPPRKTKGKWKFPE